MHGESAKHPRWWAKSLSRLAGALILLGGIFLATSLSLAAAQGTNPVPSIFEPHSTPADEVYGLSLLVLVITGAIFLVVFSLLFYVVVKFPKRASTANASRPSLRQHADRTGLDRHSHSDRGCPVSGHGPRDSRDPGRSKPATAVDVTAIGHQFWWEFRYPALGIVTANELHIPVSDPAHPDAHILEAAFRRHRSQFLGSSTCGENRPDSESRERDVAGPARDRNLSGAVRAVLRHATREDALARIGR